MTRIYDGGRPVPPHIILEDFIEDVEIGLLKRGKEAEVYLIERVARDRSCLLAEKRYAAFEQRVFKKNEAYRSRDVRAIVRDGHVMREAKGGDGLRRAMRRGTEFGRREAYARWVGAESAMLTRLWKAGAPVPYPIGDPGDGLVMEYIGDREQAAPRLAQVRPDPASLADLFDQLRSALLSFARAGVVHGDLSPYNILVWQGRLWVIDVPQAVPYLGNDRATDFLYRDVHNVCDWFVRRGMAVDAEAVFADVLSELFEYQMTDLFVARD